MAPWMRSAGSVVAATAALAGVGAGGIKRIVAGSLPETAGTVAAPGLHGTITIERDAWGIPRVSSVPS